MMKKIISIVCVLLTVFLVSCKNNGPETITDPSTYITEKPYEKTTTEKESTTNESTTNKASDKIGLSESFNENLTDDEHDAYKIIVKGIDNGESEISVDLTKGNNSYNKVKSALWWGYPLFKNVQDLHYYSDKKVLRLVYSKSQAELKKDAENFYKKVDTILTDEIRNADDFSKAILIYDYISAQTPDNNMNLNTYDVIMNGKGSCTPFSTAFEYLLSRVGVDCIHVTCENEEIGQTSLTLVKLGSNYYFMSPYHEAKNNGGKFLRYFALNELEAKEITGVKRFIIIDNEYKELSVPETNDTSLSFISYIDKWSLDVKNRILYYEITDNKYTYKY